MVKEKVKIKIISFLQVLVEFITLKQCWRCEHCDRVTCVSPRYEECISKIYPVGFKRRKRGEYDKWKGSK